MRTLITSVVLGAATIALAACDGGADREGVAVPGGVVTTAGSGADQSVTVEGADGQRVVVGSGASATATSAPAFAQPYPGAQVQQSVQVPGQQGGMLVFSTDANPDTVIAYYQARAEEAGFVSGTSMTQDQTRMYGAENPEGGDLAVVVAPVDGASSVTVTWSAG